MGQMTEFSIALNYFIGSGSHNSGLEQALEKTGTLLAASRSSRANSDKQLQVHLFQVLVLGVA